MFCFAQRFALVAPGCDSSASRAANAFAKPQVTAAATLRYPALRYLPLSVVIASREMCREGK